MNRFRGVDTEQTDFFIFSVIPDHNGIAVNNPDDIVLSCKSNRGNDDEKEEKKIKD